MIYRWLRLVRKCHFQQPKIQQRFQILLREVFGIPITTAAHDLRFGAQLRAESKDTIMWGTIGVIGGIMRGHRMSILRPNLFQRNRGQRNHCAEHVALDKLRGPAGVEFGKHGEENKCSKLRLYFFIYP